MNTIRAMVKGLRCALQDYRLERDAAFWRQIEKRRRTATVAREL